MAKIDWQETEGTVASVERNQGRYENNLTVVFTYKVDGHWYGGTFTSNFDPYVEGQTLTVRYDPNDPATNDLAKKENRKQWFIGIILAILGVLVLLRFLL